MKVGFKRSKFILRSCVNKRRRLIHLDYLDSRNITGYTWIKSILWEDSISYLIIKWSYIVHLCLLNICLTWLKYYFLTYPHVHYTKDFCLFTRTWSLLNECVDSQAEDWRLLATDPTRMDLDVPIFERSHETQGQTGATQSNLRRTIIQLHD